jgi:glycosyltransferase involved in cell wall biosynthesis
MRHSAIVTADSHGLARKARSTIGSKEPVVAPMPERTDVFYPSGDRTIDRLLLVADLDGEQGVEDALRALATMRTKVSLDIVGRGPRETEYRELAASLTITERVRWHTEVSQTELPRFFQNASALVVPSLTDWLPPVAVQALLCRTPVVAFDFGGVTDVVQHGRTGILVPPGDALALSRALDALLSRSDSGANLGEAGRMYALATFAPESVARRFAGLYRQALAASPP